MDGTTIALNGISTACIAEAGCHGVNLNGFGEEDVSAPVFEAHAASLRTGFRHDSRRNSVDGDARRESDERRDQCPGEPWCLPTHCFLALDHGNDGLRVRPETARTCRLRGRPVPAGTAVREAVRHRIPAPLRPLRPSTSSRMRKQGHWLGTSPTKESGSSKFVAPGRRRTCNSSVPFMSGDSCETTPCS